MRGGKGREKRKECDMMDGERELLRIDINKSRFHSQRKLFLGNVIRAMSNSAPWGASD